MLFFFVSPETDTTKKKIQEEATDAVATARSAGNGDLALDGPELGAAPMPTTPEADLPSPLLPHPLSQS